MDDSALEDLVLGLLKAPDTADLAYVRALTRAEIERRRTGGGCGDALYGLCFLLYLVGDASDVFLIDDAKHANFDAGVMIDVDFYRMRRTRDEMLAAVRGHVRAEELVRTAFDAPNYPSPRELEAGVRHYFGLHR